MNREYTVNEQRHVDRDDETIKQNQTAAGTLSDLALIQSLPDVELKLSGQMNQRVRVRRNGILYGINERNGPSTGGKLGNYVYAVGADLGDGLEFPYLKGNCYPTLHGALHALRKCITFDPRQSDIPAHHRATHFSVSVTVPSDD